jgi:hypothetical protein
LITARSSPSEEGGSATGVLITDECHGPCGDGLDHLLALVGSQASNFVWTGKFLEITQITQM